MKPNEGKVDEWYMRRCLQLARNGEGTVSPNPMVGAVVVHEGRIIGEGYHIRYGGPHAEVNAIASVRQPRLLPCSIMYVSLEPCAHYGKTPPCADFIVEKGLRRVVVGCRDPFAKVNGLGIRKLLDAGIEVTEGVLADECRWLNRKFFALHTLRRPYITLKWAKSEDGFIDRRRDGCPHTAPAMLSTPITQTLVHQLRTASDAILVGAHTAMLDDPSLTVRLWAGRSPLRLVIDLRGSLPRDLRLFNGEVPTRAYVAGDVIPAYAGRQVSVVRVDRRRILEDIMADLAEQGVQSLVVEGGAATLNAFISQELWDEARVETSPQRLADGVEAPSLPAVRLLGKKEVDGNLIETFAPLA